MVWIGILLYTDPTGLRLYLASQVTEQSPLGEAGGLPAMPVPGEVLPTSDTKLSLSGFPSERVQQLLENQTLEALLRQEAGYRLEPLEQESKTRGGSGSSRRQPELGSAAEVTWGAEDEEGWRRLSFRHWPSLFSYYNITLAKRLVGHTPPLFLPGQITLFAVGWYILEL